MFTSRTKAPLEFSRLLTKTSGNELRKLKKKHCLIYLRRKTRWVNKLPQLCIFFLFLLSFNLEHAKGCVSLLFSQIKCGPSIRIFFVFKAFIWAKILVTSVWGERSRWGVDNRGEITVLEVFDMQNSNCSQSSGARCSTEEQLHINVYFLYK